MKLKEYQTNVIHLAIGVRFMAPYCSYPHINTAVNI